MIVQEREAAEANIMQYGAAPGSWEFRDELAKFLTEHYKEPVNRCVILAGVVNMQFIVHEMFLVQIKQQKRKDNYALR